MLLLRPWIGIALLAVSWLFGLNYYELPSPCMQVAALVAGVWLLRGGKGESALFASRWAAPAQIESVPANPIRAVGELPPQLLAAILVFLLPVIWWTPWPYRVAPLVLFAGLLLERAAFAPRVLRAMASGAVVAGVVLLLQAAALTIYAALTARSHDLPAVLVTLLSKLCWLAGLDAAGDGPLLVMQSMRQPIRLAITWDMVFDPITMMFLVGGLAWIVMNAGRQWAANLGRFALIVLLWLPIRTIVMVSLYLHRAALTDPGEPLHVANQFLSTWVLLAALAVPVLLAWRWVRVQGSMPQGVSEPKSPAKLHAPDFGSDASRFHSGKHLAAAACCLLGSMLVAVGLQWEPVGNRKAGRVMFVERHAPWSPSDRPYDTEHFGGGDGEGSFSYTYTVAYEYLGQYYEMSRLAESGAIDDKSLAGCDVLVIKMPKFRYAPEEVRAVVNFVRNGGGLLLIGDHTNLDLTSAHMNDIARAFGFIFRDDVLYSTQNSPDEEHYAAPTAPHPAIQHVPAFDFLISCSVDPGYSWGRPVVAAAGLWSMPANYNYANFMPEAQHVPDMRFGAFIQAWATHAGSGRVIAWGDSTIFSSFCIGQPGKFTVLLNMVEWLNHQGGTGVWWLWTVLGLAAIGCGLWLGREDGSARLLLLAALACGWTLGTATAAALLAREMPLPSPLQDKRMPLVVIDRTVSRVPLANSFLNDDAAGGGFGLLEQWIPRLGYQAMRGEGDAVFQGDAVVMLYPNQPTSETFRRQLVRYVSGGGRLLVIDAGMGNVASTANQILWPFGLSLDYEAPLEGELMLKDSWPRIRVEHAWEVLGGKSFATLDGERTVCATAEFGKGIVMVVSFGSMFNDKSMGMFWSHDPTPEERTRYDVLFALLRRLVKGEPVSVPPARMPASPKAGTTLPAAPKDAIPSPLDETVDPRLPLQGKKE